MGKDHNPPKEIKEALAEISTSTPFEPEDEKYILTPEEEERVIDHARKNCMDHLVWKLHDLKLPLPDIQLRVSMFNPDLEINREEILRIANSNKHQKLWHDNRREQEKKDIEQKKQELIKTWTASRMYKLMRFIAKNDFDRDLLFNDQTKNLITTICFFLSRDPRFESELGYSHRKGLLIRGISGLGKTFLFRCVQNNELNPVKIINMIEVADDIRMNGEYDVEMEGRKILYLDDVGSEEATVNHFGTRINFFKNFIETSYLRNRSFENLVISTNNSFAELEEKYGFRVRSRIKDMFNIVDVKGEDLRGR